MPYRCRVKGCGKKFSVKTGTVMEGSKLGYQVWVIAIFILTTSIKGVSSMKLHRDLGGVRQKTAWFLAHRIRQAWDDFDEFQFIGTVEVDETYVGGKEKNKHGSKKLRQGRGAVGNEAVFGILDRESRLVKALHVPDTTKETLQGEIRTSVVEGSIVFTDEHKSYEGLMVDFEHDKVSHSVGQYVKGMAHTNGIESFWALLKRGYIGTYHKMSVKHLNRYVTEFAGRFNARPHDTEDQMEMIATGMLDKRLKYQDLVARDRI